MRRGIGVPCLVSRPWNRDKAQTAEQGKEFRYLPKRVSFPVTLLVRWPDDCSILDVPHAAASVEVIDPIESISVSIAGRAVPIEVDYTTPIAAMVAHAKPPSGIDALIHTDKFARRSGFVMFQPYRADRIMVLFVHGLASGPDTWLPLYNRLLADETIRTRFQFAFWFYPTGSPALASAAVFRKALLEARDVFAEVKGFNTAPEGVICAHSLGGVLSSTLVIDSGDRLWNTAFTVPPEKLPADEETLAELKDALIFEHLPFVKRVVYFATPHRGSPQANTGIVQWASGLIQLPRVIVGKDSELRKYVRKDVLRKRYTIAQSLGAHNPVFEEILRLPVAPGVICHSIIGNQDEAGKKGGTDGLVPYWSSHVDDVASEAIFKSGHSVQHTPEAARETMRILLEHLKAVDAK